MKKQIAPPENKVVTARFPRLSEKGLARFLKGVKKQIPVFKNPYYDINKPNCALLVGWDGDGETDALGMSELIDSLLGTHMNVRVNRDYDYKYGLSHY